MKEAVREQPSGQVLKRRGVAEGQEEGTRAGSSDLYFREGTHRTSGPGFLLHQSPSILHSVCLFSSDPSSEPP